MHSIDPKWKIVPIFVGAMGLLSAVFLGKWIGEGEAAPLVLIIGSGAVLALIAGLRQNIWLLVPVFWGLTGSIYVLPLPFAVRDLAVMLTTAVSCALFAMRIFKFRNRWGWLDFILLLNLVQICLVFLAHPVGLRSLSSETVGARAYFNIAIATLAYLILSNQALSGKLARALPILIFIPEAFVSLVSLLVQMKPSLGLVVGRFYTGFLPPVQTATSSPLQRVQIGSGKTLITLLCSYFRPLTLVSPARPIRVLLLILGFILVLIAGYRSQLMAVIAVFVLASYFHGGIRDLMFVLAGMVVVGGTLVLINSAHPLPLPMQRSLSFLPGNWDAYAVADAAGSTEWRVDMWRNVSKSGRYIANPWMGDGFGFTRAELQAMERELYSTGQMSQEDFMIIGAFHNGPLSAIRFVGIVGLILYYALLIYSVVFAWRLIRACEGSEFYSLAMFTSLAIIWEPFNYTFVFGSFDAALPSTIFAAGMLKLVQNSLVSRTEKTKTKATFTLSPVDQRELALP
jgi:hypothetical protein